MSVSCAKNEPKTSPLYLLVLLMIIFPALSVKLMKEVACFQSLQRGASRLGEAWPKSRLERKTYSHKDKARLTGTRICIIDTIGEVPARLNLK